MIPFDLAGALLNVGELGRAAGQQGHVTDVVVDSRKAGVGSLFVALEGETVDGHTYAGDALSRGAVACVVRRGRRPAGCAGDRCIEVEEPLKALAGLARYVRRRLTCRVVGITGSVGKTTTKDILAEILASRFKTEKAPESFNNALGVPLTIFRADAATEVLVGELGANRPGEIADLARILAPTIGIIVSIAPVHLEGFGSLEGVIEAKGELASALQPDARLYLAGGMPGLARFRSQAACEVRLFGEGTETEGGVTAAGQDGLAFRVGDYGEFFLPGASRQHLGSALAAISMALDLDVTPDEIRSGLERFRMPRLRWQQDTVGGATFLLDCYNASPTSVRVALEAAATLAGASRRLITVLGDMRELGSTSERYHRELGSLLADTAVAQVFLCGNEVAATRDVLKGGRFSGEVGLYSDRERLACAIAHTITPGDVVLFKASRLLKLEEVARKVKEKVTN